MSLKIAPRQLPANSEPERILDLRPHDSAIPVCIIQFVLQLIRGLFKELRVEPS